MEPVIKAEKIGPALALASFLDAEITHTVYCGDNYMGSNTEDAIQKILEMLKPLEFDVFLTGSAFQAGRYGVACGNICKAVKKEFGRPLHRSLVCFLRV